MLLHETYQVQGERWLTILCLLRAGWPRPSQNFCARIARSLNARFRHREAEWSPFIIDKVDETFIIAPFSRVSLRNGVFLGGQSNGTRLKASRTSCLLARYNAMR